MKVFFDASTLLGGVCGISVYIRQMLQLFSENEEIALHAGLKSCNLHTHSAYKQLLTDICGNKITYHKILLPGRLGSSMINFSSRKYDIIHYPSHVAPCFVPPSDFSNVILTVHDMFTWHKEYNNEDAGWSKLIGDNLPDQAEKSMAIFTDSEFSKIEINKYLGVPLEKIYSVPLAAQWSAESVAVTDVLQKNSLVGDTYFLTVTSLIPHKNDVALLTAFKKYQQSSDYAGEKLIVVGNRKERFVDICQALDTTPNVIHLQNIPENDLRTLYENSKGFFLVSKLEGFGIPLLEAMSCKVPACYGKGSSMDEIGRDAAYGVNPDDIDEIARTFAIFSAGGSEMEKRVADAYTISQEYSYEKTAKAYVEIYKKLLNK